MKNPPTLHVATYNIHKGFSQFNRRVMLHELRDGLRRLGPDILFLQEVQGQHLGHAKRIAGWPSQPQHEFLADELWAEVAYGKNAVYRQGHHGNAILSRFPILYSCNQDVTRLSFERRGLLHCAIEMPGMTEELHCVCVHLSLFDRSRRHQLETLGDTIEALVPARAPLIIAGDFNDWRNQAQVLLAERLHLCEVFKKTHGRVSRSFPARMPIFRLDRIYVRGFKVVKTSVHLDGAWARISDHAALSAHLAAKLP